MEFRRGKSGFWKKLIKRRNFTNLIQRWYWYRFRELFFLYTGCWFLISSSSVRVAWHLTGPNYFSVGRWYELINICLCCTLLWLHWALSAIFHRSSNALFFWISCSFEMKFKRIFILRKQEAENLIKLSKNVLWTKHKDGYKVMHNIEESIFIRLRDELPCQWLTTHSTSSAMHWRTGTRKYDLTLSHSGERFASVPNSFSSCSPGWTDLLS